ncbi:hypothetical protein COX03_00445 [Candidatus Woesebacteria bacterium CG22_combo_CG10-13_8_21_14_all_39_10]|uniref:Uncharacterized protein n=1 Tax=Candidatus Woesebacteria bacterium CG22_combo_CG10-13_8_21_14_all_39_10 TaxID=1975059 RepID=A0A2H0BLL0_9BACT|nr:MAG: hypothetical protein COX03_00445 [Candidatus Woesebacteria bacterium CG22_combo_CG10-13_8_21_14_all_39_10]
MEINLNNSQIKGLSGLFFDIAKGLLLGSIGISTFTPLKIITILLGSLSAFGCVFASLYLLGRIENND